MNENDNIIPLPSLEAIEAEAATWVVVLGREAISPEDLARFNAWMNQGERHRGAFNALSGLWRELAVLKELPDIAAVEVSGAPAQGFSRRKIVAAAACIPFAVLTVFGVRAYRDRRINQKGDFSSGVGEQKTVRLADRSVVELNTDSAMRVDYNEAARRVWLLRGEAYFDVAKDPERPYLVFAAGNVVEAVGTAFTVRMRPDSALDVTVEEGRVALSAAISAKEPRQVIAELTARQSAVFSGRVEHITQLEDVELVQKLAWRQGLLAYAGVPLSDVVADVSRYTDVKIEFADPALGAIPIGGVFRVNQLNALFDSLHLTFGLRVERVSPKLVRISKAT
jgi:transmembrane sensor